MTDYQPIEFHTRMPDTTTWPELAERAAQVLAVCGEHAEVAMVPGDFYRHLIEATLRADRPNMARIAGAFPAVAWAVIVFKTEAGGHDKLAELAATIGGVR